MTNFSIRELELDPWGRGVHEIGALTDKATGQVSWKCSCGSAAKRTVGLLVHMVGVVDAEENVRLLFDGPTSIDTSDGEAK